MKFIKYKVCIRVNYGTEEEPKIDEKFSNVVMSWNETNEEIAKREAYNSEYVIEDDGKPDPTEEPTWQDKIEAQVTYNSIMLGTLIEEV